VTDNASLIYNRSDLNTFGGTVSGSGNVLQAGSGTSVIAVANSYSRRHDDQQRRGDRWPKMPRPSARPAAP
jgi:hypothetical protein